MDIKLTGLSKEMENIIKLPRKWKKLQGIKSRIDLLKMSRGIRDKF